jgi:4-diphosphocytidyl-2-C-methyl-D-erythritol kinase
LITFPNAKLNIGLQITEKRPDGFHNLVSCFVPLPWTDVLEVLPASETAFSNSGIILPDTPTEKNLCFKAYQLLKNDFDLPPVHTHLHKHIPVGAGLGGGSSDAAFMLKTLNSLFKLELTTQKLQQYAQKIGSDCAFFIENQVVMCYEKGDIFESFQTSRPSATSFFDSHLKDKFLVLVYPDLHISTQEAYQNVRPTPAEFVLKEFLQENAVSKWKYTVKNDFEDALFPKYPILNHIKNELYDKYGALYASMSGSGSTIFGIFEREIKVDFPENYTIWKGYW